MVIISELSVEYISIGVNTWFLYVADYATVNSRPSIIFFRQQFLSVF